MELQSQESESVVSQCSSQSSSSNRSFQLSWLVSSVSMDSSSLLSSQETVSRLSKRGQFKSEEWFSPIIQERAKRYDPRTRSYLKPFSYSMTFDLLTNGVLLLQ